MIKNLICVFVFSLLVTSSYGQTVSQVSAKNKRSLESQVDVYIKPYLEIGGFNGTVLIAKGGKVLLSKGYGSANYELGVPNTPQTKFHIASVSKTFTATAIMLLQERGLLNVSDSLTKFIPDYPNGDKITVHHLLTNTSGIPNINNFPDYDAWSKFPHTPEDLIEKLKINRWTLIPESADIPKATGIIICWHTLLRNYPAKVTASFLRRISLRLWI